MGNIERKGKKRINRKENTRFGKVERKGKERIEK